MGEHQEVPKNNQIHRPHYQQFNSRWYEPKEIRAIFGRLQPQYDAEDNPIPDTFDRARKSHYGHNILISALMCGREDARARLQSLPDSTRFRIEAELRILHTRRQGRPLEVAPDPLSTELEIVS